MSKEKRFQAFIKGIKERFEGFIGAYGDKIKFSYLADKRACKNFDDLQMHAKNSRHHN